MLGAVNIYETESMKEVTASGIRSMYGILTSFVAMVEYVVAK
jgi:hypothetical protein